MTDEDEMDVDWKVVEQSLRESLKDDVSDEIERRLEQVLCLARAGKIAMDEAARNVEEGQL